MSHSVLGGGGGGGERRYSVPSNAAPYDPRGMHSEDLHAWSIYRQNLNSDFTDSALGSTDKSPLPYGNFQLRDTTVQSILAHPRYGPKSALGSNMYTYLKFGLPRVFPPNHNGSQRSGTPKPKYSIGSAVKSPPRIQRQIRGMRETSSGYDSSDNETTMNNYKNNRKYRSDPDFRMQNLHPSYQHSPGMPLVAMHQAGIRGNEGQWTSVRNKSVSEANLLAAEGRHYPRPQHYTTRRTSASAHVADFGPDADHHSYLMSPSQLGGGGRPASKAGSHMSLAASRLPPHASYMYPNYFVNNLEITSPENKSMLLVSGLSFEVKSGELLAILATSQNEATGLLDVLAGVKKKLSGDLILNGQPVSSSTLSRVVGYVRNDTDLCPDLTTEQTLHFHAHLRKPQTHKQLKVDMGDKINLLIEELGLEQVRDTSVGRLTRSELRRLNVACQMLLETQILILEQPIKEMDIFDTFFLVEYLRNWASTGRVVIMSLHPPTYEIFGMLTKVVLVSAGRTMYSGYRRDMLPYFASIDYPSPVYKNPSDFYLDLVALDDLSAAAMLESSGRIEHLAGVFRSGRAADPPPQPPPPGPLPAPHKQANVWTQAFVLFKKTLFYTQLNTIVRLISRLIVAAILSLITGAIFWDLPSTDPQLSQNDRVGFHYAVMCLTLWPLLLLLGPGDVSATRKHVERDISAGLYGRTVYILCDEIMDTYSSACVFLAFLIPSYAMSGLYVQGSQDNYDFYIYLGYSLVYLMGIHKLCRAVSYLLWDSKWSMCVCGVIAVCWCMTSGALLQWRDVSWYMKWSQHAAPARWMLGHILRRELSDDAVQASQVQDARCRNKQVHKDIIVQAPCPLPNGTQVLANYEYLQTDNTWGWESTDESVLIALLVFWGVFLLLGMLVFIINCCNYRKSKARNYEKGYKTTPNAP